MDEIWLLLCLQRYLSSHNKITSHTGFKRDCKNINGLLSGYLKNITNGKLSFQTWENYGENEKFKKLFNDFIDALKNDKPIFSDIANLMEFFIDNGFKVENDYDVPEFISKSWHNERTRKVILGMADLAYKGSHAGSDDYDAVVGNLAKNIDANAEKHREALKKL